LLVAAVVVQANRLLMQVAAVVALVGSALMPHFLWLPVRLTRSRSVVAATEVLRGKTADRLVHRLFSALSRQQVAGMGHQEQQPGVEDQEAAVGSTSLLEAGIPRQHHHPKVITAVEEQAHNHPVLAAGERLRLEPAP